MDLINCIAGMRVERAIKMVEEGGVNYGVVGWDGNNALMLAAAMGQMEVVEAIVANGNGTLDWGLKTREGNVISMLMGHAVYRRVNRTRRVEGNKGTKDKRGTVLEMFLKRGMDCLSSPRDDEADDDQPLPIVDLLRALRKKGVPCVANGEGSSPLHQLCKVVGLEVSGYCAIIQALLGEDHTRFAQLLEARDGDGYTALFVAAYLENIEMMRALLQCGAEARAVDREGSTLLMCCIARGRLRSLHCLMTHLRGRYTVAEVDSYIHLRDGRLYGGDIHKYTTNATTNMLITYLYIGYNLQLHSTGGVYTYMDKLLYAAALLMQEQSSRDVANEFIEYIFARTTNTSAIKLYRTGMHPI
jgi:ankyrin repeat protein